MDKDIYIYFDDANTDTPLFVGVLTTQQVRGREVFSFQFDEKWLADSRCHLRRKWANLYHISRDEQEMMATAFKV
jgi:serine/threonine-protein kinase HipA